MCQQSKLASEIKCLMMVKEETESTLKRHDRWQVKNDKDS